MGENAYEISLPPTLQVSLVFNVADLTLGKGIKNLASEKGEQVDIHSEDYVTDLPQRKLVELEEILDTRLLKLTETKKYM